MSSDGPSPEDALKDPYHDYAAGVPTVSVPINGKVLEWALEQALWSAEELAEELRLPAQEVSNWIEGTSQPSTTQFRTLARKLKRPTSLFLLDEPPSGVAEPPAFRASPRTGDTQVLRREAEAIRLSRRLQQITVWTRQQIDEMPPTLPKFSLADRPDQVVPATRKWLNWSVARQTEAASATVATKALRRAIEDVGIIVTMVPLGHDGCRGFSLNGSAPLIAVNTAYTTEARSFSMLHELAHLTLRKQAICGSTPNSREERWCEEFAAHFLLPTDDLVSFVRATFRSPELRDPQQVSRVANYFKASRLATATALRSQGLISQELWTEIRRQSEFKGPGGGASELQTSPVIRYREWGATPTRLLFEAEQRRILTRTDLQEYLRLSDSEVSEVRERISVDQGDEDRGPRP